MSPGFLILGDEYVTPTNSGSVNESTKANHNLRLVALSRLYVNHGNILGHLSGKIHNQVNITEDAACSFTKDGMSFNLYINRGLTFVASTSYANIQLYQGNSRKMDKTHLGAEANPSEMMTGLMYFCDREKVNKDLNENKVTYFPRVIPSKKHKYLEIGVHEFRYKDRKDVPDPAIIVIGKTRRSNGVTHTDLNIVDDYIRPGMKRFPNSLFIWLPGVNMVWPRKPGKTGNTGYSMGGHRIMEVIAGVRAGLFDDLIQK